MTDPSSDFDLNVPEALPSTPAIAPVGHLGFDRREITEDCQPIHVEVPPDFLPPSAELTPLQTLMVPPNKWRVVKWRHDRLT